MSDDTRPLAGLLVLTLEQAVAAPLASCRLADAGARVIKVERAEGDFARRYDRVVDGESAYFVWLNRGKQSLVADIKSPADSALLHRIIERADVFIQNLAPGAAERAGFGSGVLRERHPWVVTCEISGYGECAEYADMKAYDLLVQAESGLCSITGTPESPGRVGVSVADIACGMNAHAAILEALLARTVSGRGSGVATSLFEAMADWMSVPLLHQDYAGVAPKRVGVRHPSIHPYGVYPTRDGPPILISIQNEREFAALCEGVLEQPWIPGDTRFASNTARVAHADVLDPIIESVFTAVPRDELKTRLRQHRIAFGELNDVAALSAHPALARTEVATPSGNARLVAPPARLSGGARLLGPVPAVGEHGAAIRAEFGGTE